MEARLINRNHHGVELRLATRLAQTWPWIDCPLGRAGYWAGKPSYHVYLGRDQAEAARIWAGTYEGEIP